MTQFSDKMTQALKLLAEHKGELVLVSNDVPIGRHLGPSEWIPHATARALASRGLATVRREQGRADRDRGLNRTYAQVTDEGVALAASLNGPRDDRS